MSLEKAKALFVELVANVAPEQWDARLAVLACGDDTLHRQVSRLLAAHREAGSFLESPAPALGATIEAPVPERSGAVIGPYKLIEPIGEGGMGTVWMAQQTEPVKRLVAIKFIKAGMDSKQVIARFEAERQALALMDHPNIAKVLDGGTTSSEPEAQARVFASEPSLALRASVGRPYFVMDLVKGVPITKYCDEHHLTPRQRLELFIPVCQAVQHAHQKGIIHRDLKPSNVLVALYDGKPVPKVIDFGVAKATGQSLTDKTLVTGFGSIVGTLEYMSPEQAETNQLDIDTRSDIYSLGVLLYELLAGSPPFTRKELEKAGMLEMLRVIREEEPSKPSTKLLERWSAERGARSANTGATNGHGASRSTLRAQRFYELDWIAMKALEKDRNRRYETANGFAMDVQRYLADESVLACPPSVRYRLRKFARRNKGPLLAATLLLLAMLGGIAGTTLGLVEARHQRDDAVEARQDEARQRLVAEAQRDRAVKAEAEARTVLRFFETQVLSAARPKDQEGGLGIDATIRNAVDGAEPKIAAALREQPLVEASIRNTMGVTYFVLGQADRAIRQHERALALRRTHLGPGHDDTVTSMNNLALAYQAAGRLEESLPLFEQAFEVSQADLGPEHPNTLTSMNNLAVAYQKAGRLTDALPLFERELKLTQTRVGPEHPDTLISMNNLALAYQDAGWLDKAIPLFEQALHLTQVKLGLEHPETITSVSNLAGAYRAMGRLREALPLYEQALQARRARLGHDHPDTLGSMNHLGMAYRAAGRPREALALLEEAYQMRLAKVGPEHPDTVATMDNLAMTYQTAGRVREAVPLWERALELRRARFGLEHPDTLTCMNNLAGGYLDVGRLTDAVALFQQTLKSYQTHWGPEHPSTIDTMSNLALAYQMTRRLGEALAMFKQVLKLRQVVQGLHHPRTLLAMNNLATAYLSAGQFNEALPLLEQALKLHTDQLGADHPSTLMNMNNLASAHQMAGRLEEAIALFKRTRQLTLAKLGQDHPDALKCACNLALAQAQLGQYAEAIKLHQETLPLRRTRLGADHTDTLTSLNQLAWLLANCPDTKLRNPVQALALAGQAVELAPKKGLYWNTLGTAHYRSGDWKAALAATEKAMQLRHGGNGLDWFVAAMAHWQLGEKEKARAWYDRAVVWMDKNEPNDQQLRRFRMETEELIRQ